MLLFDSRGNQAHVRLGLFNRNLRLQPGYRAKMPPAALFIVIPLGYGPVELRVLVNKARGERTELSWHHSDYGVGPAGETCRLADDLGIASESPLP